MYELRVWVLTGDQLKKLKSIDVHKLQKELQEEKEKNSDLKEKLKRKQKAQSSKLQRFIEFLQLLLLILSSWGLEDTSINVYYRNNSLVNMK